MNVLIVSESRNEDLEKLKKAFTAKGVTASYERIGSIGLLTEKDSTSIFLEGIDFNEVDACFIQSSFDLTQFIEPFLDELSQRGIYCQIKPESYFLMSNKAFQTSILNSSGIRIPNTTIFSSFSFVNGSFKEFSYPLLLQTFKGYKKIQNMLIESQRSFISAVKSIKTEIDSLMIQDYYESDLDHSVVIGEALFTVKRKWNKEKLEYAKKGHFSSLNEKDKEMVVNAAISLGAEIATVKSVNGIVLSVSPLIDFSFMSQCSGKDLWQEVVKFYSNKLDKGEEN